MPAPASACAIASAGYDSPARVGFDSVRSKRGVARVLFSSRSRDSRLGGHDHVNRRENMALSIRGARRGAGRRMERSGLVSLCEVLFQFACAARPPLLYFDPHVDKETPM